MVLTFSIWYDIEINTSVSLNTFLAIFSELVYQASNKTTTIEPQSIIKVNYIRKVNPTSLGSHYPTTHIDTFYNSRLVLVCNVNVLTSLFV